MITALAVFAAVIGVGIGLWEEFSEQRRLNRMARDCKTERGHYERNRA